MSNIEDDIKILTEENSSYKKEQAMQNILSEREQDKARIKELEEENRIFKNKNVLVNRYFKLKDNSIPKQKVKDKIEELENAKRETTRENWHYIYSIQLKILQELLEEGE